MNKVITIQPQVNVKKVDTLVLASLLYLLIPNLIFIVAWFKLSIAFPILCLLAYAIFWMFNKQKFTFGESFQNILSSKLNLQLLCIALFVCFFTGAGVLLPEGDLPKHHAILKLLIEEVWPVVLQSNGDDFYLVYYIAWYLPAALVGKIFGSYSVIWVLFLEGVIGVWLTLKWVTRLALKKETFLIPIAFFLLFEGQDSLYILLKFLGGSILNIEQNDKLLFDLTWQFSYDGFNLRKFSTAYDLAFVPQQVLGAWVTTALIINEIKQKKHLGNVLLFFSLTALWSILCTIGLIPILIAGIIKLKGKGLFSKTNFLGALPLGILLLFYFTAHLPIEDKGWIWEISKEPNWLLKVVAFILFEFGIYAFLIHKSLMKSEWKHLWLMANISLVLLSFYVLGTFNDLLMRASIPLHFVFILCIIEFYETNRNRYKRIILFVLLATSSISFFLMEATLYYKRFQYQMPSIENNKVFEEVDADNWFYRQYLGESASFYGKYLSK